MITAGIDCGARNTKTVILQGDRIIAEAKVLTGFDQKKAVEQSLEKALQAAGIAKEDIAAIGGTGSGKDAVMTADKQVNDIIAVARGAIFFFPAARTVADIGAEEGRVVKVDDGGNLVDFAVNEKCAAGAGAFIEAMSRALEVSLEEMGSLCLQSDREIPMNAQCAIFAESEVVGLIHAKTAKPDISKAIHNAMAGRIASLIRRMGINEDVVMLGGVGHNPGFVAAMQKELEVEKIHVPDGPEYGAAVGAAIVAVEEKA